ncbi:hypothetical protein H8D64_01185 [PVC group bacterium]|nr:hypothetical protein [PVC group bacterium]
MSILDRIILLLTGLIAIVAIGVLGKRLKAKEVGADALFCIVSFTVFLVAGLLLIIFGWGALKNNFVAVVAGLIPFSLASGLVKRFHPKAAAAYIVLLVIGLALLTVTRYGNMPAARIVYPVFHAIAGITIVILPLLAVKSGKVNSMFSLVALGGALISTGGVALAFLTAGKQLLFFSQEVVLLILAPLLFLTALCFALGLLKGNLSE